ncbi:MAG: glycosyltransferase family 2 protein [bacterium]
MLKVGAVIVTYHTSSQLLQRCLISLRANGIKDISVINNTQENNPGFAAAANNGAAKLGNEYLLFINPDAFLTPGSAAAAQDYLECHPGAGIVGFLLTSPGGQPEKHSFGRPVTPLTLITRHFTQQRVPLQPASVGWVSGGAMLIRRNLFRQLGGFDPRFFLYWEDVDLCYRARQAGHQIIFLPQAKAVHQRGASLSDRQRKTKLYDQSADKYFRKHYPDMICLLVKSARSLYRFFSPLSL